MTAFLDALSYFQITNDNFVDHFQMESQGVHLFEIGASYPAILDSV